MNVVGRVIKGKHSEFRMGCGGVIALAGILMALLAVLMMSSGIM